MYPFKWAMEYPDIWLNVILNVSGRVFGRRLVFELVTGPAKICTHPKADDLTGTSSVFLLAWLSRHGSFLLLDSNWNISFARVQAGFISVKLPGPRLTNWRCQGFSGFVTAWPNLYKPLYCCVSISGFCFSRKSWWMPRYLSFITCNFGVVSKKAFSNPRSWKFSCMFSSESFNFYI